MSRSIAKENVSYVKSSGTYIWKNNRFPKFIENAQKKVQTLRKPPQEIFDRERPSKLQIKPIDNLTSQHFTYKFYVSKFFPQIPQL